MVHRISSMPEDKKTLKLLYAVPAVYVSMMLAPQSLDFKGFLSSLAVVARYVIYIQLIRGSFRIYNDIHDKKTKLKIWKIAEENKKSLSVLLVAILLLTYMNESVLKEDFPYFIIAFLIANYYQETSNAKPTINYGTGMACSFFEGYLVHIIPSDGSKFVGFQDNIKHFEDQQRIFFPVKKLFIIITKNLFCPPDLKHCNKENRSDLPYLEAIASPPQVEKDVAGVKGRTYRNSAYKIYRPNGQLPVPLCAEFATPLHTLKRVLDKRFIYQELCDVDKDELVRDFCAQLEKAIDRSPECSGKCVLVHYDNTDDSVNLADVLLDKVRDLQPDFEDLLLKDLEARRMGVERPDLEPGPAARLSKGWVPGFVVTRDFT